MKIVMTTFNRKPSYVTSSLGSLFFNSLGDDIDVDLVVHERDPSFLSKEIREDSHIRIHTLTAAQDLEKSKLGKRVRVAQITRIALEIAGEECLVFQDDVQFAPNWYQRFMLSGLRENRDKTMVALYSYKETEMKGLVRWTDKYWGLCAMYFGNEARLAAIEALDTSGKVRPPRGVSRDVNYENVGSSQAPGADVRLAWMLERRKDIELFALYPSLVQHTGGVSSIDSRKGSFSPTFGQDE